MDIQILLWFQGFREATSTYLSSFFSFLTNVAVDYWVLVPMLIIFWTVDKRVGSRILISWGSALSVGAFLKATFCVYRPWVRDPSITPPADIVKGATGYSFPSGHSVSAGSFWSAIAFAYKKHKGLVAFCVIMILLTMTSRLYFTVHTPQDVLVGAGVAVLVAWGVTKLCDWIDEGPNRDITVLAVVTALMVALLCYTAFKQYPMDYVDGTLLVDPTKMTVDGFKDPGRAYGIFLGWFIERRWVKFQLDGTVSQKVMRALVGGLLVVFWWNAVATPVGAALGFGLAHFVMQATTPLLFMTVYPWAFNKWEKKQGQIAAA